MFKKFSKFKLIPPALFLAVLISACLKPAFPRNEFLSDLKHRTFNYFWDLKDPVSGQIPDRYPTRKFYSIAATGFGLTSYLIGIENNYISRAEGREEVLHCLQWLWNSPQGPEAHGIAGYKGFYYHFLNYKDATRYKKVELSTVDTGWLMAGILACQSYFNENDPSEENIRILADSLFLRVDWEWAMNNDANMSMGWHPESGFIQNRWKGYNEAMMIVIMGLGSPAYPLADSAWKSWCKTYQWEDFKGYEHLNFSPLFGHQYTQMFIDFRGIQDSFMREKGIDYFENSRRATLSNRQYCIDNPRGFDDYGENVWGLSACDGPSNIFVSDTQKYKSYWARGASALEIADDGTITPTAAGGSIPFAPEECLSALYYMRNQYKDKLYQEYGFKDAFNLGFSNPGSETKGWFDKDYLGIDQGPILIQLENYQSGLIWNIMKKNKYIIEGLKRAGFSGGWLDQTQTIL
ncbi:MAG: Tat pathway signal protein [Bacteroidales bacterium]|nr:Tat pathway signal protein [Bacteroidales bacterium]